MKEFTIKCLVVTFCVSFLMIFFYPRYQGIDKDHRIDTITGTVETKTCYGWH